VSHKFVYELHFYPSDGCLSHKSAVAAGVLAVYLHNLIEVAPGGATAKEHRNSIISSKTVQQVPQPKQHQREILRDGIRTKHKYGVAPGKISLRKVISSSAETRNVKVGKQDQKEAKARRGDQDLGQDYAEENDDYQGYANHDEENQDNYNDDRNQQAKLFIGQKAPIKKKVLDGDNDQYDEEQYDRYYYDAEEEGKKNTVDKNKDILIVENTKQEQSVRSHKAMEPVLNQNNIPTTHLFVFSLITLVLLYFMYRFIRKRRLLIRYPFSGR
jgi:hypothetical protein